MGGCGGHIAQGRLWKFTFNFKEIVKITILHLNSIIWNSILKSSRQQPGSRAGSDIMCGCGHSLRCPRTWPSSPPRCRPRSRWSRWSRRCPRWRPWGGVTERPGRAAAAWGPGTRGHTLITLHNRNLSNLVFVAHEMCTFSFLQKYI